MDPTRRESEGVPEVQGEDGQNQEGEVMGLKYRASSDFTEHPNGSRVHYTPGAFKSVAKVANCPCEDGKWRNAFATAEPDTFFSIPACVYVGKKTVGGFLSSDDEGWKFTAYGYGKNAGLIKKGVVEA